MMLIHFGTKLEGENLKVRLPRTPAALPGADLPIERLVVAIDSDGRLLFEGSSYDEASAKVWWAAQAKTRKKGQEILGVPNAEAPATELPTLVVVRADREASYGTVRRMLSAAQEEGFARFSLVTLRSRKP
jgi:biopolymer transport protein ExbD